MVGRERKGGGEACQGLVKSLQLMQSDPAIGMGCGGARIDPQRLLQDPLGLFVPPSLELCHAEEMKGIEVTRVARKRLPATRLHLRNRSGLVQQRRLRPSTELRFLLLLTQSGVLKRPQSYILAHLWHPRIPTCLRIPAG